MGNNFFPFFHHKFLELFLQGLIIDFVLASIKTSKFVVADFTCEPESKGKNKKNKEVLKIKRGVRGGVYYEAGFAKGLGLQVIHLCKDDNSSSKGRLHFDIEHENTILWTDDEVKDINVRKIEEREDNNKPKNFSEKLHDRIIHIFGYGPLRNIYYINL